MTSSMTKGKKDMSLNKRLNQGYFPAIVLMIICLIFTALLSITNEITSEKRLDNKNAEVLAGKKAIFPEASDFKSLEIPQELRENVDAVDLALDENGNNIGITIQSKAKGYNGFVPVIVGIGQDMNIKGISFTANDETAGLGSKIKDPPFSTQFDGASAMDGFSLDGSRGQKIQAVSGATFSSVGAMDAINFACVAIEKMNLAEQLKAAGAKSGSDSK